MSEKQKKESPLVKLYIIVLFFLGMGIWFAMQDDGPKRKVSLSVELDNKITDTLAAGGVRQEDIISQYARDRESRNARWSEFYKKIHLRDGKKPESFENSFRTIARSAKVGLSKTRETDGSVTYRFYSPDRTYSNITFAVIRQASKAK